MDEIESLKDKLERLEEENWELRSKLEEAEKQYRDLLVDENSNYVPMKQYGADIFRRDAAAFLMLFAVILFGFFFMNLGKPFDMGWFLLRIPIALELAFLPAYLLYGLLREFMNPVMFGKPWNCFWIAFAVIIGAYVFFSIVA